MLVSGVALSTDLQEPERRGTTNSRQATAGPEYCPMNAADMAGWNRRRELEWEGS